MAKATRVEHKIVPPGVGRILISVAVIALVAFIYAKSGFPVTRFLNRVTASSGTILTILSFVLGPLSWWLMPKLDPSEYRKFFGIAGFSLLAIHGLLSLSYSSPYIFTIDNLVSITAAMASFALFSLLAATSSDVVFDGLGYDKWKRIQRLGYVALGIALVHFVLTEAGAFKGTVLGEAIIGLASLAILWRVYFVFKEERK
jgi:DMSO/TMAO reductase YedYZ heme-binding membrane subunit